MKFSTTVVVAFFAATAFAAPISDIYARAGKGGAISRKTSGPKKVNWSSGVRKANDMINIASDSTDPYFEDFLTLAFGPIARLFTIPQSSGQPQYRRDDSEFVARELEDVYAREYDDLDAREFDDLYARDDVDLYARDDLDLYAREDLDLYARDDLELLGRFYFDDEM